MIAEDRSNPVDLAAFHRALQRFIKQGDHALTIRQLAILLSCYLGEEHTVRRLALRFGASKSVVSRMLDHLVDEGLIERRIDPRDRRSVLFVCTSLGKTFLERMKQPVSWPAPGAARVVIPALRCRR